jgi:hypothetical protein
MQANLYTRSAALPAKPVIVQAVSFGHDSASLKLATDLATNADAPIAFYTITINRVDSSTAAKVETKRIYSWRDLELAVTGLQGRTTYTFTVTATTVDGTSAVSLASLPVTTPAYVPSESSASSSNSSTVAAPAFALSSTAETKTVNNAITGYTITSTGGTIASYAISPAAPAGTTFSTTTGLLTGTPTAIQSATAYTITGTNVVGSASKSFMLTVEALVAPAFTLTSVAETKTVNTTATGFTINSTGGAIASFAISATAPGMNFNTSTGALTGTPNTVASATTYTVTATNAAGSATQTFTLTVIAVVYTVGQTGPGGGRIYYYSAVGFTCGPTFLSNCNYLEVAPSNWSGGSDPSMYWEPNLSSFTTSNIATIPNETSVNNSAGAIGLGYKYTLAIVGQSSDTTTAAVAARAFSPVVSGATISDWYLPTSAELNLMCQWQRGVTQDVSTACSGGTLNSGSGASDFFAFPYWTSSEYNNDCAWAQDFGTGVQAIQNTFKNFVAKVRPIRAF